MYMYALLFSVQWSQEQLEDTKGVIRIRKARNNKYNGQKNDKQHLQKTT